jgi:hypothetical protein
MTPSESARRLRIPGYLIMWTVTIVQLVDVVIRAWPFRIHSPAWRLGVIGFAANAVGTTMISFLVILGIAVAVGDRGVSMLVAAVSAVAAVLCLLATGIFTLDALQMKGQVDPNLSHQYDLSSFWLVARVLVAVLIFGILAMSAFRISKALRREIPRTNVKGGAPLVVGTARSAAPSPAAGQRSVGAERGVS